MSADRFTIHDARNRPVLRFQDYRRAERAAIEWCRQKSGAVPICEGRTLLATAIPECDGRARIDLTFEGGKYA